MAVTYLKVMSLVVELRFPRLTWTMLGCNRGGRRKSKKKYFPSETSGGAPSASSRSQGQSQILMSFIVFMEQMFESLGPKMLFPKSSRW